MEFKIWVISFSYIDWVDSPRSTGHFLQMAICVPGALPVSDCTSTPPVNVSIQWSGCLVQIFALLVPSRPALILLATRQKTLIGYVRSTSSPWKSFLVGVVGYYIFSCEMARRDSLTRWQLSGLFLFHLRRSIDCTYGRGHRGPTSHFAAKEIQNLLRRILNVRHQPLVPLSLSSQQDRGRHGLMV